MDVIEGARTLGTLMWLRWDPKTVCKSLEETLCFPRVQQWGNSRALLLVLPVLPAVVVCWRHAQCRRWASPA